MLDNIKDLWENRYVKISVIGGVAVLGLLLLTDGRNSNTTTSETSELDTILVSNMEAGVFSYSGYIPYLSEAIMLSYEKNAESIKNLTQQDYQNKVATGINKMNTLFPTIVSNPETLPEEIAILFDFSYKLDDYVSGKVEISTEERESVVKIIEKYLPEEEAVELVSTIQTTYFIDMVNNTESDFMYTNTYNAGYTDGYATDEGNVMEIENDTNKNGIPELEIGKDYVLAPTNGIQYCYEYTGENMNIAYKTPEVPEGEEAKSVETSYLYIYDDYNDCLQGTKSIATNGNDGTSTTSKNSYSVYNTDYNSTGPSNGTIDTEEAGEVTAIETGQYVSVSNVSIYTLDSFNDYLDEEQQRLAKEKQDAAAASADTETSGGEQ